MRTATKFWSQVRVGTPDECWPFLGSTNGIGYGRLRWFDGLDMAHRVAYRLMVGPLDAHTLVRHTCDNPPCCNPDHLKPGDAKKNMEDARRRNRLRTKLSQQEVNQLRCNAEDGTKTLSRTYGISERHVRRILTGQSRSELV